MLSTSQSFYKNSGQLASLIHYNLLLFFPALTELNSSLKYIDI